MSKFREPTKTEKDYIKTHFNFLESNSLFKREVEIDIDHDERMIVILNQKVECGKNQISNSEAYAESSIIDFIDWCKNNNIDHLQFHPDRF